MEHYLRTLWLLYLLVGAAIHLATVAGRAAARGTTPLGWARRKNGFDYHGWALQKRYLVWTMGQLLSWPLRLFSY
jgi:hypothetical protein